VQRRKRRIMLANQSKYTVCE